MDDTDQATTIDIDITTLAADVVSSYVAKNSVPIADLPQLIADVHASFAKLQNGSAQSKPSAPLVPAVPVKKSVTADYIICLEDGRQFKSLKRHLASHYGLTPDEYRKKWNLPDNYPMVSESYATTRSALAKQHGLGRKPVTGTKTKVK